MKKFVLIVLVMIYAPLYAEKLNLNDRNLVERFGMNIVKSKIDLYDPDEFGLWVLENDYRTKYQKVRNDEFELDDAKKWAFEKFKKKLSMIKSIDPKAIYHLYLKVRFGKYDFKNGRFPVEALTENSYMQYAGKGKIVNRYAESKLFFDNANSDVNYIAMDKQKAKHFLQTRKNRWGDVDRSLVAHYIYKINSYEEEKEFQPGRSSMILKFTGTLISVEFMDKKTKNILGSVTYDKHTTDKNNTKRNLKQLGGVDSEGNIITLFQ